MTRSPHRRDWGAYRLASLSELLEDWERARLGQPLASVARSPEAGRHTVKYMRVRPGLKKAELIHD